MHEVVKTTWCPESRRFRLFGPATTKFPEVPSWYFLIVAMLIPNRLKELNAEHLNRSEAGRWDGRVRNLVLKHKSAAVWKLRYSGCDNLQ